MKTTITAILISLTMMSFNVFAKESITTNINISATVFYQCQVPSNDKRVADICSKQLPPKIDNDGKYITHTY